MADLRPRSVHTGKTQEKTGPGGEGRKEYIGTTLHTHAGSHGVTTVPADPPAETQGCGHREARGPSRSSRDRTRNPASAASPAPPRPREGGLICRLRTGLPTGGRVLPQRLVPVRGRPGPHSPFPASRAPGAARPAPAGAEDTEGLALTHLDR